MNWWARRPWALTRMSNLAGGSPDILAECGKELHSQTILLHPQGQESIPAFLSTTVPFLLLTYGRMLWGGAGDGSKGVFLQERVPSGGRICGTSPASGDPITPPFPEAGSSSAR